MPLIVVYPNQYGPGKGWTAGYYLETASGDVQEAVQPQLEFLSSFLARYQPTRLFVARHLLFATSNDAPEAVEETPISGNFIARYRPAQSFVGRHLLFTTGNDAPLVVAETPTDGNSSIQVIVYNPGLWAVRRHVLFGADVTGLGGPEDEIPLNFIGRYHTQPTVVAKHLLFSADIPATETAAEIETTISVVGRYHIPTLAVARHLLFTSAADAPTVPFETQTETIPSTVGRFHPGRHTVAQHLLYSQSRDVPPIEQPGDSGGQSIQVIVYSPSHITSSHLGYYQSSDTSQSAPTVPPEAETLPPNIGKYHSGVHRVARNLLFSGDTSQSAPTAPEEPSTDHSWHARLTHAEWNTPLYGLGGNPSEEPEAEVQPETNVHLRPRHRRAQHFVAQHLFFQNEDISQSGPVAESETNPPFLGHYRPAHYEVWPGLRFSEDLSQSGPIAETETNPPFVGRYTPGHHRVVPSLLFAPDLATSGPVTPEADTLPQWQPRLLPNSYWIDVAKRYYLWNGDTSESAPTVPPPTPGGKRHAPIWMRRLELELVR